LVVVTSALGQDFGEATRAVGVEASCPLPTPDSTHPILQALAKRQPALADVAAELACAFLDLARCFRAGGTLFLCGNGGSMADALHISGELLKSYACRCSLPARLRARLASQPDGELLARNLEPGLRAVVLGVNPSLTSAVANDMSDRNMNLAQELLALARPGDMLLGISTSGNARNVAYAAQTARALGLTVIALTGESGGRLAALADIAICVPVQELHIQCSGQSHFEQRLEIAPGERLRR
jgi:D-sedoheptulose 7-phosphate isomerase